MEKFNFETLEMYKKAIILADDVYKITKKFPKEEMFGLTNQFRRASISVVLNIAEGVGRTKKEFNQFLRMAKSSIHECVAILEISFKQKYITEQEKEELKNKCVEISRMISGLKKSIKFKTLNSKLSIPDS